MSKSFSLTRVRGYSASDGWSQQQIARSPSEIRSPPGAGGGDAWRDCGCLRPHNRIDYVYTRPCRLTAPAGPAAGSRPRQMALTEQIASALMEMGPNPAVAASVSEDPASSCDAGPFASSTPEEAWPSVWDEPGHEADRLPPAAEPPATLRR
jgi:hypothetical protein